MLKINVQLTEEQWQTILNSIPSDNKAIIEIIEHELKISKDINKDGIITSYNEKRDTIQIGMYVKGKKEGLHEAYEKDGRLISIYSFLKDKKHGIAIWIDREGYVSSYYTYKHDKKINYHDIRYLKIEYTNYEDVVKNILNKETDIFMNSL